MQARLYTDVGTFYASQSGWNFYAGLTDIMDELAEQTRRAHEGKRQSRRARPKAPSDEDVAADPELEEKIRAATGEGPD